MFLMWVLPLAVIALVAYELLRDRPGILAQPVTRRACASCGQEVEDGWKVCPRCGQIL